MKKVFKYVIYAVVALSLGLMSTYGQIDYIASLQSSIVQLLVALLAVYSTISSILVLRFVHFKGAINNNADLSPIIRAMKRNVIIESLLILLVLIVIIVSQILIKNDGIWCTMLACLRNSVFVFALLYFVVVVYDSSMGLYDLLEFESSFKRSDS